MNSKPRFSLEEVMESFLKLTYYLDDLAKSTGPAGTAALPPSTRAIILPLSIQGEIAYGGLSFYYSRHDNPSMVAWAFRQIGLERAGYAMEQSKQVFPDGMIEARTTMLPVHWTERIDWMKAHKSELEIAWDKLEDILMVEIDKQLSHREGDTVLVEHIRNYIKEHLEEFEFKQGD